MHDQGRICTHWKTTTTFILLQDEGMHIVGYMKKVTLLLVAHQLNALLVVYIFVNDVNNVDAIKASTLKLR